EIIKELLEWAAEGVRRVLVVGLEDRGNIAISLASSGLFVTVVDPDESLIEYVTGLAEKENCSIRMNFYASDYMKREFSSSGFDMAVFFSALSRYNEPEVVVKKATRELRAGGKLFARIRVRPSMGLLSRVQSRFSFADRLAGRVVELSRRVPGVEGYLSIPESKAFLDAVSNVLKVEKKRHEHFIAPGLGWIAAGLPSIVRAAALKPVDAVARVEAAAMRGPLKDLATYLVIFATKELGLGKAFRV
ncbi:MAG: methyltransferase domain-containing protein, partial [Deltaproteobacteria bacterium]|nr:methyltransferase domain-containing protein [Deltaproteobacteria bacterium]